MPYSQSMSASWEEEICISLMLMESSCEQNIEGASSRLPEMHLLWKLRLLKTSRLLGESPQLNPEKSLLPYELNDPGLRPAQS